MKLLPGPVEAGHDGPDRNPEDGGGVLVGETLDVDQEHDLTVERVELLDRLHHLAAGDAVEDLLLRPLAEVVAHLVVEGELADVVDAHRLPVGLLEAIPVKVAHYREEPGLHVGSRLVGMLVAQGAGEGVLDQVLGLVGVAAQPQGAPVERVEVADRLLREVLLGRRRLFSHEKSSLVGGPRRS